MKKINFEELTTKKFETNDTGLLDYNGYDFTIIRELNDIEVDEECRPMFAVKFTDGFEMDVFPDEIFTNESLELIRQQIEEE